MNPDKLGVAGIEAAGSDYTISRGVPLLVVTVTVVVAVVVVRLEDRIILLAEGAAAVGDAVEVLVAVTAACCCKACRFGSILLAKGVTAFIVDCS